VVPYQTKVSSKPPLLFISYIICYGEEIEMPLKSFLQSNSLHPTRNKKLKYSIEPFCSLWS
jgi:hypothetical protein